MMGFPSRTVRRLSQASGPQTLISNNLDTKRRPLRVVSQNPALRRGGQILEAASQNVVCGCEWRILPPPSPEPKLCGCGHWPAKQNPRKFTRCATWVRSPRGIFTHRYMRKAVHSPGGFGRVVPGLCWATDDTTKFNCDTVLATVS